MIQRNVNGTGLILERYTAKELNIEVGEILIGLHEWNGWIWCEKLEKEAEGWVPKQNVKQYK
ncbi:SH3 domain-containing protein [Bacillus sp. NPDC094106]|uniref:SH3 domain-containing protein n=1 Tax=Bacillus sp. NPDC094106 TaxID=3363949 RepID=UPI00382850ED